MTTGTRLLAAVAAGALTGELVRKRMTVPNEVHAAIDHAVVDLAERVAGNFDRLVVLIDELNRNLRSEPQRTGSNYAIVGRSLNDQGERLALAERVSRQGVKVGKLVVRDTGDCPTCVDQLSHDSSPSVVADTATLGDGPRLGANDSAPSVGHPRGGL